MIVIKNIEYYEVDRDEWRIHVMTEPHRAMPVNDGAAYVETDVLDELIRGNRFRRPSDGIDVCIGMSKEHQKLIGIQYEAWEGMSDNLYRASRDASKYKLELGRKKVFIGSLESAGLWQRIKWVFTGIQPDNGGFGNEY